MRKNRQPPVVETPSVAEKPSKVVSRNGSFLKDYAVKCDWPIDEGLADGVLDVVGNTNAKTIADFGAGLGKYVQYWRRRMWKAIGFDGIPDIEALSGHAVSHADLSTPKTYRCKWDWVVSFETGAYIPPDRAKVFIQNLVDHCTHGVIVTWQEPDTKGRGFKNLLTADQLAELFAGFGFVRDAGLSKLMYRRANRKIRRRVHVFVPKAATPR